MILGQNLILTPNMPLWWRWLYGTIPQGRGPKIQQGSNIMQLLPETNGLRGWLYFKPPPSLGKQTSNKGKIGCCRANLIGLARRRTKQELNEWYIGFICPDMKPLSLGSCEGFTYYHNLLIEGSSIQHGHHHVMRVSTAPWMHCINVA